MEWAKKKMRLVAQSGRMLRVALTSLQQDGEVCGLSVSALDRGEQQKGICGFCANEPTQMVGMELQHSSEQAGRIRLVTALVCLPLCTDCVSNLMPDLKLTVG